MQKYEVVDAVCSLDDCFNRVGLEKAKKELAGSIAKGISFIRK